MLHAGHRHPLCPSCQYDLVATVDRGGRVCPECGCEFEVHELLRQPHPGDWTEMIGLRRLAWALGVRAVITLLVWAGWLWVVSLVIPTAIPIALALLAGCVVVGIVMGRLMWSGLTDRCGFDGPLPGATAVGALLVVLAAGSVIIGRVSSLQAIVVGFAALAAATAGLAVILPRAFLEE